MTRVGGDLTWMCLSAMVGFVRALLLFFSPTQHDQGLFWVFSLSLKHLFKFIFIKLYHYIYITIGSRIKKKINISFK